MPTRDPDQPGPGIFGEVGTGSRLPTRSDSGPAGVPRPGNFHLGKLEPTLDVVRVLRSSGLPMSLSICIRSVASTISNDKTTDWEDYTHRMIDVLHELNQPHYIKKDLQKFPPGYHNPFG